MKKRGFILLLLIQSKKVLQMYQAISVSPVAANVTHQTDKVLLEANAMYTNSTQNVNNEGTSFASPIMCYAMTASPSTYPYNEDGSFSSNFPALEWCQPYTN